MEHLPQGSLGRHRCDRPTSPRFLLKARSPLDLIPSRGRGEAPFFFHEIRYASSARAWAHALALHDGIITL